jgi:DNA polymerase-3 subunit alpha
MAALLTNDRANTDDVVKDIAECRAMGIPVLPPDVNGSDIYFTVVGDSIRFGLAAVKNVGLSAIEAIIEAREAKGRFSSLADLCRKVDQRRVNRRVIEALIKCGACDSSGARRSQMTDGIDLVMDQAARHQEREAVGQFSIFDAIEEQRDPELPNVP